MVPGEDNLEGLLAEGRAFPPDPAFTAQANANRAELYEEAARDNEGFWARMAGELTWFRPWEKTLEWEPPFARWFTGGRLNAAYNCVDRHLGGFRRNKAAIIWEGELGEERTLTYQELHREVCKFANVLKGLGVGKGDRVTLYMPLIPELVIAMLASARLGAVHSVIFGGFSVEAVRDRIEDAGSKVVVTADGGYRRGSVVQLKHNVDLALRGTSVVEKVVVVKRVGHEAIDSMQPGRDYWWGDLMREACSECPPVENDAEDMLFILYTSGTTGKPKGIVHSTGGYLTGAHATTKFIFDLKEEDVYWCTADIGWITGHTYVVYGPLSNGATIFMYEGAPDFPTKDRYWALIAKHRVNILYTAPTAIRTFMKWGAELPAGHDLSSLRLLGTVGEPINPEAWIWLHQHIGKGRCPIVDTWWQTETGAIMITPLPGLISTKPGSATRPFPGIAAAILDGEGNPVPCGKGGYLVITKPWPSMLRNIFGDTDRYKAQYWSRYPGCYFTGDGARQDDDGYFWLLGRIDDVIKVSGHRIGTMEVESALIEHRLVAEAAVIGRHHEVKGQAISAFVTLKDGVQVSEGLVAELKEHVAERIGAIARPDDIVFAPELPKTRSGKIIRRLLRDIAESRTPGDTTTLADPAVMEHLKKVYTSEAAG